MPVGLGECHPRSLFVLSARSADAIVCLPREPALR